MSLLRPIVLLMVLVLCGATFVGCNSNSGDEAIVEDPFQWTWVGNDFFNETQESIFIWNSSLTDVVLVEFKGDPFEGLVNVRVFDGAGLRIFDEDYQSLGLVDIRETDFTAPALAGNWTIKIDLTNVTGDLRVIVTSL